MHEGVPPPGSGVLRQRSRSMRFLQRSSALRISFFQNCGISSSSQASVRATSVSNVFKASRDSCENVCITAQKSAPRQTSRHVLHRRSWPGFL